VRHRFQRRVPEDIRVVGFDDIQHAGLDSYRLSTVAQNVQELARHTVQVLVERMNDFDTPAQVRVVPVSFVERDTAGPISG
jgi:DNA-binding LacI/PurR family transcriptional regulator